MLLEFPAKGINYWSRSSSTLYPKTTSDKLQIDGAVTFSSTLGVTGKITGSSGADIAGRVNITSTDGSNHLSLVVTQNDVTNNPEAVNFINAGTAKALGITQNGILSVNEFALDVRSTAAQTNSGLVHFYNNNVLISKPAVWVWDKGIGDAVFIDKDNYGNGLNIDADADSASDVVGLLINAANAGAGDAIAANFQTGKVQIGKSLDISSSLTIASTCNISSSLEVLGETKTGSLQMTSGVTSGYFLMANDATGNAVWSAVTGSKWTESSGYIYPTTTSDQLWLSGNENIEKADPEYRLTDTGNSEYTRITKADTNNQATRYNRVSKPGALGKAVDFGGTDEYLLLSSSFSFTSGALVWWSKFTWNNTHNMIFGQNGNLTNYFSYYKPTPALYVADNAGAIISGSALNLSAYDGVWAQYILNYDNTNWELFVDNVSKITWVSSGRSITVNSFGYGYTGLPGAACVGSIDEISRYSNTLSSSARATLYGAGVGYYQTTGETSITNLWHIDEGSGTTAADSVGSKNFTLTNMEAGDWVEGKIQLAASVVEPAIWNSQDGISSGEVGIHTFGTSSGTTIINGALQQFNINGTTKATLSSGGYLGINTASPTSNLHSAGSFAKQLTVTTSNTTLDSTSNVLICNAGITVTLPASSSITGREYIIKNISTSVVTINVNSTTNTIDGSTSKSLANQYDSYVLIAGNNQWSIV